MFSSVALMFIEVTLTTTSFPYVDQLRQLYFINIRGGFVFGLVFFFCIFVSLMLTPPSLHTGKISALF